MNSEITSSVGGFRYNRRLCVKGGLDDILLVVVDGDNQRCCIQAGIHAGFE